MPTRAAACAAVCAAAVLLVGCADLAAGAPAGRPRAAGASPGPSAPGASPRRPAASPQPRRLLAGVTVGIDPGHNGLNYRDPSYINHLVWNGRQWEACDTTGTQTDAGYSEPRFTFAVARLLKADLLRQGARVVATRAGNHGVGPCVNRRAQILNRAHPAVSIDIHADGGPAWGRGFAILEPVADGPNDSVISASRRLGRDVRAALLARTAMPVSDYYGHRGIEPRGDLAGLNLTTEPKVLVECGNMRNAADAALLTAHWFQRKLAAAFTAAIIVFLRR